ncbi:hypothetical protein EW026_g5524 [Hermanssonia centrifuga]|uniref:Uncharacterized protein n=1 Tax=Hermanssonia centrifuga TaxID=98765 RepID=A0A4S4KEX7_9APHY|nr:hypothetical protein EW026_g5524 [Hermanssonia centrifuga]
MQYQYIPELHPRPDFGWSSALQLHVSRPLFSLDAREAREDWMEKSKHTAIHRALLCHADADAVPLKDVVATSKGDVDTPCRIYGWTPMEWGIFMYVPDVVEILLEGGADLKKGYPLHRAANTGNIQALRSLMHAGADINLQDEMGRTPLHFIAYEGKDAAATELFKFGGTKLRWDALSIFGHTPLERAQHGRSYFSALGLNVDGHDRIIQSLSALQEARRREAPSLENSIAFRDQLTVHHGGNAIPGSFLEEWIGEHFVYNRGIGTHT